MGHAMASAACLELGTSERFWGIMLQNGDSLYGKVSGSYLVRPGSWVGWSLRISRVVQVVLASLNLYVDSDLVPVCACRLGG